MDTNELVIDTKDLSKSYNGVAVLDSLNLQVPKNSIFRLLRTQRCRENNHLKAAAGVDAPNAGRRRDFRAGHRPGQHRDSPADRLPGPRSALFTSI